MSVIVSLCVIRIEICDDHSESKIRGKNLHSFRPKNDEISPYDYFSEEGNAMISRGKLPSNRGRRQVKDISIDTYSNPENTESASLLTTDSLKKPKKVGPKSGPSKDENVPKKDEKTRSNVVDLRLEPITFVSGNHMMEVTRGILHLYKEE